MRSVSRSARAGFSCIFGNCATFIFSLLFCLSIPLLNLSALCQQRNLVMHETTGESLLPVENREPNEAVFCVH